MLRVLGRGDGRIHMVGLIVLLDRGETHIVSLRSVRQTAHRHEQQQRGDEARRTAKPGQAHHNQISIRREMFPISDVIPSRTRPVVTISLIALNTLLFLYQLRLDDVSLQRLVFEYGVIPARFSYADLVSSMFLHGDFLHFAGNMVFLWIFGDNVEDRLGHAGFVAFYIGAGAVAAIAQVFADPTSFLPMIGASGAIAGVMGAYFLLYPHSRILTAVFLFLFLDIIEIPAIFFLGVWFLLQLFHGAMSTGSSGGGVAFWAHAGGFAAGALVGLYIKARDRANEDYWRNVG